MMRQKQGLDLVSLGAEDVQKLRAGCLELYAHNGTEKASLEEGSIGGRTISKLASLSLSTSSWLSSSRIMYLCMD